MSDPMTTIEIEDVLSSIRRLVSEDLRPARDRAALRAVPSARDIADNGAADMLVLTAAQRVDPPAVATAVTAAAIQADDGTAQVIAAVRQAATAALRDGSLETAIVELETAVAESDQQFEPDGGDLVEELAGRAGDVPPWQPENWNDPLDDGLGFGGGGADRQAGEAEAEAEALALDEPVAAGPLVSPRQPVAEDRRARNRRARAAMRAAGGDGQSAAEAPQTPAASQARDTAGLFGTGRRLHLAPAEVTDPAPPAPEEAGPDAGAGGTHVAPKRPTRIIRAGQEGQPDTAEHPADLPDARDDMMVIDADALREIVIAILKQELQGPLGERITRNVRKLVRSEIHRVLETRDLE